MALFNRQKSQKNKANSQSILAEVALNAIHDGVVMTDRGGIVRFINPAAAKMIGGSVHHFMGLDYGLVLKLESKEGRELSEQENPLVQAMKTGQSLEPTQVSLIVADSAQRLPVAISVQVSDDASQSRVITFRNITKELAEEGEQTEFISTASHEMRTPVATIDGYLSLSLNPQTATIDERARGYLTAAEKASKHLGKLFQDLLDITKLDDGHIKPHFVPVEMTDLIKTIFDDYAVQAQQAKLAYNFGSNEPVAFGNASRRMSQVVYGFVDIDFMREIMSNLIGNALKYTPAGGSIYVNVRGDGDRVLINVTDTGIGISAEDLSHIFQKFYRVDNSDTRTIGGTGLGLYLVKQRAEAMGGKVWAESAFGEGSTFYVSLPRLSSDEYEKRMIAVHNQEMLRQAITESAPSVVPVAAVPQAAVQSVAQQQPVVQQQPTVQQQPVVQQQPTVQQQPVVQQQPTVQQQPVLQRQPASQFSVNPTPIQPSPPSPPAKVNQTQPVQPINNNNLNGETK